MLRAGRSQRFRSLGTSFACTCEEARHLAIAFDTSGPSAKRARVTPPRRDVPTCSTPSLPSSPTTCYTCLAAWCDVALPAHKRAPPSSSYGSGVLRWQYSRRTLRPLGFSDLPKVCKPIDGKVRDVVAEFSSFVPDRHRHLPLPERKRSLSGTPRILHVTLPTIPTDRPSSIMPPEEELNVAEPARCKAGRPATWTLLAVPRLCPWHISTAHCRKQGTWLDQIDNFDVSCVPLPSPA